MLIFNLFKKHDKYYLNKVKFKKYGIYLIKKNHFIIRVLL